MTPAAALAAYRLACASHKRADLSGGVGPLARHGTGGNAVSKSYTIAELRAKAAELAPAGRNGFPGICGLMSTNGEGWKPAGLYSETATLKCVQSVFMRMLDAAEGFTLYRPSNGTEGEIFMSRWCHNCAKDNLDVDTGDGGCEIIADTMALDDDDEDYPRAWRLDAEGVPMCAAFEARKP